jgi:glycerophosphoryl diester phosphodiesterase
VEIIAHRGASYDAPENTLAAIHLAWEQNADAVEIDVQFSKDGKIVVIHDDNTHKTGGLKKKVCDQTLAELGRLDVGTWKGQKWKDERIPTLDQVLEIIPEGKRLFVEIKCGPECLGEFRETLRRSGRKAKQVVVIGYDLPTMRLFKSTLPELEVCWITVFKRHWKTGRWTPRVEDFIRQAKEAGLDGLDFGVSGALTAQLIQQVKAAGLSSYVWTVDSAAKARALAKAGIDGITSNRPAWLRTQLDRTP